MSRDCGGGGACGCNVWVAMALLDPTVAEICWIRWWMLVAMVVEIMVLLLGGGDGSGEMDNCGCGCGLVTIAVVVVGLGIFIWSRWCDVVEMGDCWLCASGSGSGGG